MNRSFAIFSAAAFTVTRLAIAQSTTAPVVTTTVMASSAPSAAPLERATDDAVARLYARIADERVNGLPIGEIVERVGGKQTVLDGLSRAQQIGGPRTVGDGVVQVNLEIRGSLVADLILRVVHAAPDKSPITPRALTAAFANWSERSFSSTGDNSDAASVAMTDHSDAAVAQPTVHFVLPGMPPAWTNDAQTASASVVAKQSPLITARAAERAARAALKEQLAGLSLDDHTKLGGGPKPVTDAVDLAVSAARISSVDYRADGGVEVHVSIDGQQLWQTLQMTTSR